MDFLNIDWHGMFMPASALAEIFVRGTLMYFVLFGLLRLIPNRHLGTVGIADVLVVVLLASAAQNAMTNGDKSVTGGVVLVGTIVFWSQAINWLGFRLPWFQRMLRPPAMPLMRDGRVLQKNLARELITEDELLSKIRQQGIGDLSHVRAVYMEGDGRISVVTHDTSLPRPGMRGKSIH